MKAFLWLTQDLRIEDNALLHFASENSYQVGGFAFEPLEKSKAQSEFYLRSVFEIKNKFEKQGLPFFILKGDPVLEIHKWFSQNSFDVLLTQQPFNSRDLKILNEVKKTIGENKVKTFYHQTLFHPSDLPFEIDQVPWVFTEFRKQLEKNFLVKPCLEYSFEKLKSAEIQIPPQADLSKWELISCKMNFPFSILPGERASHDRLNEYFWKEKALSTYKETRNGMLGKNDSSKFSPGLSCGCISAKQIYHELKKYEEHVGENDSTRWFIMELLWRDYFKILALKIGEKLFLIHGLQNKSKEWIADQKLFERWCRGETGIDFVDANMIELNETGWMSNRGRQNVASFLAKNWNLDWRLGAQYFENNLIDYDTENNWGNWLYLAGVGTDPRDRLFNISRQAELYDPLSNYRQQWLKGKR